MKKKIKLREKIFFSPWAMLSVFVLGIALMNVVAFADDQEENYARQKANIDMANDGIVGYTHDGLPVYQSDIPEEDMDYKALGLRQLDIQIKGIKKVTEKILNESSLELYVDNVTYTILVDCKLTPIDTFQWQTKGDGALNVGDFALTYRDPFHNFGNPKLKESLTREDVEKKLQDWDLQNRICSIVGIQKKVIEVPKVENIEDIRG